MKKSVACIVLALTLASCETAKKSSTVEEQWINNMHRLSSAQVALIPLVADPQKISDPSRRMAVENALKNMSEGAEKAVTDPKAPNADPIIAFTARRLSEDMKWAFMTFRGGDLQAMRPTVLASVNYCVSCHTRADRGAQNFPISWTPNFGGLNPIRKTEVLLANRQYEDALKSAEHLAVDEVQAKQDPLGWKMALVKTLAMVVRVKADPNLARKLTGMMNSNKGVPRYLKAEIGDWKKAIDGWSKSSSGASETERFTLAKNLIVRNTGYLGDSRLISLLVASGYLHTILENSNSKNYAEALYYSGLASEGLKSVDGLGLSQAYYASCILQAQHSLTAEKCYGRLESDVSQSGLFSEADPERTTLEGYLAEMRKLAEPRVQEERPRLREGHGNDGP